MSRGGTRVLLAVQPGTQIYGYGGTTASLVVTRGSMIEAIGLPGLPIIMGAVDATGTGAGPFWDGWTYRHVDIEGGLPGVNFHPLEAEITP